MNPSNSSSPWITDTTAERFELDVIERSRQVPVVVDFWAAWCQPCRLLGPMLEKLAEEYAGRFVLVKADVEQMPGIAAQLAVQSIPAVFGLYEGKLVDSFVGVLPEPQLREWIDRFLPTPADLLASEAETLEASDLPAARDKYEQALRIAPDHVGAKTGLGRVLLAQGETDRAAALVAELETRGFLEPEAEKLKAALDLAGQGEEAGSIEACRAALAADPDNLSLKLKLGEALAAGQQYEEALPLLLSLVELDRHGTGETARALMVDIFKVLPEDSDLVANYRRLLSQALF